MRVSITPKEQLDDERLRYVDDRVSAPEHVFDRGPREVWSTPSYIQNLYVILDTESQVPIGILYAGGPKTEIDAAWWIDSRYRAQGFGSEAIDLFADMLKANGVTGIGRIVVDTFRGNYHVASCKLEARLRAHFERHSQLTRPSTGRAIKPRASHRRR